MNPLYFYINVIALHNTTELFSFRWENTPATTATGPHILLPFKDPPGSPAEALPHKTLHPVTEDPGIDTRYIYIYIYSSGKETFIWTTTIEVQHNQGKGPVFTRVVIIMMTSQSWSWRLTKLTKCKFKLQFHLIEEWRKCVYVIAQELSCFFVFISIGCVVQVNSVLPIIRIRIVLFVKCAMYTGIWLGEELDRKTRK